MSSAALGRGDACLVLVRHGQTTWVAEARFQGSADPPLSDIGVAQAKAVAARLADPQGFPALPVPPGAPRRIWHSPLSRAASTATAIWSARREDAPLTPEAGLVELAQGDWEGLTATEVTARWPRELAAWRTDPVHHHAPGGESVIDGARRSGHALQRILDDIGSGLGTGFGDAGSRSPVLGYADQHVGGPGDVAEGIQEPWVVVVAHDGILRLVLMRLLDISLDHYWALPFALCGISVVEVRAGRARLRAHNLADHLPA